MKTAFDVLKRRIVPGLPDECWSWTGAHTREGYGVFYVNRKKHRAHRVAQELFNGPIPAGYYVLHHCDNPACVNPGHLYAGTPAENMADMKSRGRATEGERSAHARLTAVQVAEIREMRKAGQKTIDIAPLFGISQNHVSNICNFKKWNPPTLTA